MGGLVERDDDGRDAVTGESVSAGFRGSGSRFEVRVLSFGGPKGQPSNPEPEPEPRPRLDSDLEPRTQTLVHCCRCGVVVGPVVGGAREVADSGVHGCRDGTSCGRFCEASKSTATSRSRRAPAARCCAPGSGRAGPGTRGSSSVMPAWNFFSSASRRRSARARDARVASTRLVLVCTCRANSRICVATCSSWLCDLLAATAGPAAVRARARPRQFDRPIG